MATEVYISKDKDKRVLIKELATTEMPYKVTIQSKGTRSLEQNRYLWGCVYPTVIRDGQLEGWTNNDLHEFFLIDCFGSEVIEGFGRKRHRPLHRSHNLSKVEFVDYVEHIMQFCAERGIVIPDPDIEH